MEVRELMAHLGYRSFDKMVGRSERLEMRRAVDHWKARNLDFSRILYKPTVGKDVKRTFRFPQEHGLEEALDTTTLIPLCKPALESRTPVAATLPIQNGNRVVGTMLGSEVTRRWGADGPAGRHDPAPVPGLGRPELRCVHPARHHASARRGRERLRRQGALGREDRRRPADSSPPSSRRRTSSSGTSPSTGRREARRTSAASPASASASGTAASRRSSRRSATTAAST